MTLLMSLMPHCVGCLGKIEAKAGPAGCNLCWALFMHTSQRSAVAPHMSHNNTFARQAYMTSAG